MEPENFFMAWFDRLRKTVDESKITRVAIAQRFDVSTQTVWNWLKGKTDPDVAVVLEICEMIGVSPGPIFDTSYPDPGTDLIADTLRDQIEKIGQREALRRILLSEGTPDNSGDYLPIRSRDETHLEQSPVPKRDHKRANLPGRESTAGPAMPGGGRHENQSKVDEPTIGTPNQPGTTKQKRGRKSGNTH
ncbi:HTH_XRE domain containing protein [uncultured Caudovirales phage]|uniref:HTH_XRE domain containing protein n=1 Tax=uncultured Caudovirales phage TaxID=2100421 RepID=A0A6J5LAU2_9CAUD|nr:HTH_XRE domain containing protein [uncultured Caudovirales phage]